MQSAGHTEANRITDDCINCGAWCDSWLPQTMHGARHLVSDRGRGAGEQILRPAPSGV